jgi:GNAT superfamily N-acetyltransferase
MIDFRPVRTDAGTLREYSQLFKICFPGAKHLDEAYLRWLYCENPEGTGVGFDGRDGDRLCAHYACIPARVEIWGRPQRALLSLNTATHPEYQGRGLFTTLAERVFEIAAREGFGCVYGIANANSTPGFLGKLRFTCVGFLDARIGLGRISRTSETAEECESRELTFRRLWSPEVLRWRFANPRNPVLARRDDKGWILASTSARCLGIQAYAEVPPVADLKISAGYERFGLRLFLGILPAWERMSSTYMSVPKALRPSPLNFIFRNLGGESRAPVIESVRLSFLDFDAY